MPQETIDMHVHIGGPEDPKSGCYWSKKFTSTAAYAAMMLNFVTLDPRMLKVIARGPSLKEIEKLTLRQIVKARKVRKVVLLALDAVYGKDGKVRENETHLFVPNEYVASLAEKNKHVLLGGSIHPYRPHDEIDRELEFCINNDAVLCKWICSSQQIDSTDVRCEYLYNKLAEYNLPLLYHTGREDAVPTSDETHKEYDRPKYLQYPLRQGVTTIAAHCSVPYIGVLGEEDNYLDELLQQFKLAEKNGWKLYADVSALCSPLINGDDIEKIKRGIPPERLLLGSDFPIPVVSHPMSLARHPWINLKQLFRPNAIEKNYWLVRKMGFDKRVFTNAARLFSGIRRPSHG